jgi:hypothetical protein
MDPWNVYIYVCMYVCSQPCSNLGCMVSPVTMFCKDVPYILSIIIAVFRLNTKICISSSACSRKYQIMVRFMSHSRIRGSQYRTCFMAPRILRWLLDFLKISGLLLLIHLTLQ